MLNRYNAFALRHPLMATVLFLGLLIVIAVVVQGFCEDGIVVLNT